MQTLHVLNCLSMVVALLLVHPPRTTAAGDSTNATEFLEDKERLVQDIGKFALQNYQNSAALAETCNTSSACSRLVCQPLRSDFPLSCEKVPRNPDCQGPNNSTCSNILVSRKRGYVRWAYDANLQNEGPTCDMKSTICSQRELDEQVFTKSKSTDLWLQGYLYFGASNGIMRIYPGKELNNSQCTSYDYDLRERPWYVGATAVLKKIVVMLDAGPSMAHGQGLSSRSDQNLFDASRDITLRLLNTLSASDKISVFTFNESASSRPAIVGSEVTVGPNPDDDLALEDLKNKTRFNLPPLDPLSNQKANLTTALVEARDQFNNEPNNLPTLKVVIIITAGDVLGPEDLQPDLVNSLAARNVTVFTYCLLGAQDMDDIDVTTKLRNASCSLNGSYEEGRYEAQNPLKMVQSFYSYVAWLRFNNDGQRPYWVQKYPSYSGISDLITVSYPVFDGRFLVGVAGVDILVDNLRTISSEDIEDVLKTRHDLESLHISTPPQFGCNQSLLPIANSSCPKTAGFCTDIENSSNKDKVFKDRTCCGSCGSPESGGLSKTAKIGIIIGGVIGGILIVGSLIGLCIFCKIWKKFCSKRDGDEIQKGLTNSPSPRPVDNPGQLSSRDEHYYDKPL